MENSLDCREQECPLDIKYKPSPRSATENVGVFKQTCLFDVTDFPLQNVSALIDAENYIYPTPPSMPMISKLFDALKGHDKKHADVENIRPANIEQLNIYNQNKLPALLDQLPASYLDNEPGIIGIDGAYFRETGEFLFRQEPLILPEPEEEDFEEFSYLSERVFQTSRKFSRMRKEICAHVRNGIVFRETIPNLPSTSKHQNAELEQRTVVQGKTGYPIISPDDSNRLIIGPQGTLMTIAAYSAIAWDMTPTTVTRNIMMALFDRDTMSTHSLTGRPSPAFRDMPRAEKKALDTGIVSDIIILVTGKMNVTPKEVRTAITTKCADESKMLRTRLRKQSEIPKEDDDKSD